MPLVSMPDTSAACSASLFCSPQAASSVMARPAMPSALASAPVEIFILVILVTGEKTWNETRPILPTGGLPYQIEIVGLLQGAKVRRLAALGLQVAGEIQHRQPQPGRQAAVQGQQFLLVGRQVGACHLDFRQGLLDAAAGGKPFEAYAQQGRELLQPLAPRRGALRRLPLAAGTAGHAQQARQLGLGDARLFTGFTDAVGDVHAGSLGGLSSIARRREGASVILGRKLKEDIECARSCCPRWPCCWHRVPGCRWSPVRKTCWCCPSRG